MVIEESNLKFEFADDVQAIKFDDTEFYRKKFNKLPTGKGVDILADSKNNIQFIEIKNCKGYESANMWRTSVDNSKVDLAPRDLDVTDRDSLDIEVAKKVASTLSCLYGAWTKSEKSEDAVQLKQFWEGINDARILRDKKTLIVILFLEGDFNSSGPKSRTKKMMMTRIQESIRNKLKWLDCKVIVTDSQNYSKKYFSLAE